MAENNEEKENSLKPEEEETSEETSIEEEATSEKKADEDVEQLKSSRDQWFRRFKIAEAKVKSLETEPKKVVKPTSEDNIDEWKMKVDFLLHNKDVSENEFDHIATVAARKGISLTEAIEQEKDYIQFTRDKVANEKKIPGSTSTDFSSSEKKISADTSKEDIDKILQERFKKSQESTKSV